MVRRLDEIARSVNPKINAYASQERIHYLRSLPVPEDPEGRLRHELRLARALLHAGQTEEALAIWTRIYETAERTATPAMSRLM